ncbi:hypothetical protein OSB04_002850 [Centaurea solstitialis]|uniref:SWIM-type domain-containing protein n=1 Tax=Centaurea solstitialis TaxID=347529 RepID=A0AA38WV07_9ASTR|nr:hypothetical protein OSB04_002850 [Centaurea solstitialis]
MDIDPTLIEDASKEEYETTDMMNFSQTVVEGDLLDECNHDTNFDAFDALIGRVASNEEFPPAMVEEEGDYYESMSVAEATYRKYVEQAGFDVRLSNKKINKLGVITGRYFVFSRTGKPPKKYFDSLDVVPGGRKQQNSNIKRTDMMKHVGNKDAQMLVNKLENRRKACNDFCAFVAIDNHKSSDVVGAVLINGENIPNFTWILQAFMKAHGRQPLFVITDQYPAMKQAIPMISSYLAHSTPFRSDFNKLVWNVHLEPVVFERKWNEMIDSYGLRGDGWFDEMYRIRECWIPAYYKDCHMSGLMKTTSRSKSINAFFNVFAEYENDLTGFITTFDNAIDEQRGKHGSLEVTTKCSAPRLVSPCEIEAQAAKVVQVKKDNTIDCSCKLFVRIGILCRHALKVMLNDESDCIPEKYILQRWRRDLVPVQWLPPSIRYGEVDVDKHRPMGKAFNVFERQDFANAVDVPTQSHAEMKQASFEEHLGVAVSENAKTLPPKGIRNKGCGTNSRMKSSAEKAISKGKKLKRKCRLCLQEGTHDSRNCPTRDGRK